MHNFTLFGEVLADVFPDGAILGGAPYNVTRHLRGLQQNPLFISRVGDDPLKTALFAELSKLDIDTAGIQLDDTHPTGEVIVHIENSTHHFDIRPNQAYDHIEANAALAVLEHRQPDIIYFGTLAQRQADSKGTLKALLNNTSCPKFLDVNLRAPWYDKATIHESLQYADIVKVNDDELNIIKGLFSNAASSDNDFAALLIKKFRLVKLFVTCGESGAWALTATEQRYQTAGQHLGPALIDTVGAGDAFSAVCMLGELNQWPIEKTLVSANLLAAEICKVRGAIPETNDCYLTLNNHSQLV